MFRFHQRTNSSARIDSTRRSKWNRLATRRMMLESLEDRRLLAVDWRDPVDSLDVNGDGFIVPIDALLLINYLNSNEPKTLPARRDPAKPFVDVNGDQFASPIDVLLVINHLNAGSNTGGNGQRQLSEGGGKLAHESFVTITLGQITGNRNYRVQLEASFDTTDNSTALEDLVAVYLVDPQLPTTTLLDRGVPGTALFTLAGNKAEFQTGRVGWDGSVLSIDLSDLGSRNTGLLKFQLLSSDSDSATRVTIKPLTNEVDTEGTVGPRVSTNSSSIAPGDALTIANLAPFTDGRLQVGNVRFDATSGAYETELRIRNDGSAVSRDVAVVFPGLPTGVTLRAPSGKTSAGEPYVSLRPAIARGGLAQGRWSDPVTVKFDNPSQVLFALRPRILAGTNRAPTLDPVAPLTVSPGGSLKVSLHATDTDGDTVTFAIAGLDKLPSGTLASNGMLTFRPTSSQVGTYEFDISASDGALSTQRHVTLTVVADPITTTRISGQVLTVTGQPLVGVTVQIGAVQGLTAADGSFLLDLGSGQIVADTVRIRGEIFPGPAQYPFIAEKIAFLLEHSVFPNVNNVIGRPIYLPAIDVANGKQIDPARDTLVTSAALPGVSLMVKAGTLMTQQGTPYTGIMTITEVPRELTPAALPDSLFADMVVTIQPGEMVFATPAPMTFPNRNGWPAGKQMDLWAINPVTGEFDDVGDMRVSSDGTKIETISGGVRTSSWQFPSPPPPVLGSSQLNTLNNQNAGAPLAEGPCNDCAEAGAKPGTSVVLPLDGAVLETHDLVPYESQGVRRGLSLRYDSVRADARPIVHFGIDRPATRTNIAHVMASLAFSRGDFKYQVPGYNSQIGRDLGLRDGVHFWTVSSPKLFPIDAALQADLRNLPSGVYDYEIFAAVGTLAVLFDARNTFQGSGATQTGSIVHVNSLNSPLGSGWGFSGLVQLVPAPDGSVLFIDGDGSEMLFTAPSTVGGPHGSPRGDTSVLQQLAGGTFRRTLKDQTIQIYNAQNLLASETDRDGNLTRYDYDPQGRLVKITDPASLVTNIAYLPGRVEITDPASRVTRLDLEGNRL